MIKKILIVDDDCLSRAHSRIILARSHPDFEIIEAETAAAAEKSINEDKPAVIVLDNRLPDTNGYLLIYRLSKEKIPHGKIIFMPGTMDELQAMRAIALGATIARDKSEIDLPAAVDEALAS